MTRNLRPVLACEKLEARECPWAGISLIGGHLSIQGDAADNHVVIRQDDAQDRIHVTMTDGKGASPESITAVVAASKVKTITMNLLEGNDTVSYELLSNATRARTISALLGVGNDAATIDFGKHKSQTVKAAQSISVRGQGGDDSCVAHFGDLEGPTLWFLADMSDGKDVVDVSVWGVNRGTKATLMMDGGNQDDSLRFYNDNGSSSTAAATSVAMYGGNGNDKLSLFFDDVIVGAVTFNLSGGADKDTVTGEVNVRATAAPAGSLNVRLAGDAGDDKVGLGLLIEQPKLKLIQALADGGLGSDLLAPTTANVKKLGFEK